ncbi:MAG: chitobiase/beta-hexosaminidase C-terminal domain-containing protein [Syntrophobacteraceae bacterium]|jgi:hypothetical protein
MADSKVASATYTIKVATPTISPAGGTYTSIKTVTLSCTTPGAAILYTTDGSNPSPMNVNTYTGPITVSSTTTIKARAFKEGMADSNVGSAKYIIH